MRSRFAVVSCVSVIVCVASAWVQAQSPVFEDFLTDAGKTAGQQAAASYTGSSFQPFNSLSHRYPS